MKVIPEIMIPLVGHINELRNQERLVRATAKEVMAEQGVKVKYLVGTMIELPRAAITADQIAQVAQFFSFGTNDMTQMRSGSAATTRPVPPPTREGDLRQRSLRLHRPARRGRGHPHRRGEGPEDQPGIKLGICGEHGGDPCSVEFCHMIGMDYVSCSPYRVPVARLAAAQAAILNAPKPAAKKAPKKTAKKPARKR